MLNSTSWCPSTSRSTSPFHNHNRSEWSLSIKKLIFYNLQVFQNTERVDKLMRNKINKRNFSSGVTKRERAQTRVTTPIELE